MADSLQLQLPDQCPLCRESRSIGVEYVLKFRRVTMEWVCRLCAYRWPVDTTALLLHGRKPLALFFSLTASSPSVVWSL